MRLIAAQILTLQGSRVARLLMRLASSSPTNSSLSGSRVSFRPSCQESCAAKHAMCELRMMSWLHTGKARDLTQSKKFRPWPAELSPVPEKGLLRDLTRLSESTSLASSPVSTQPSSPSYRIGQVPVKVWYCGSRFPKAVGRKSQISFTPLAYRATIEVGVASYSIGIV